MLNNHTLANKTNGLSFLLERLHFLEKRCSTQLSCTLMPNQVIVSKILNGVFSQYLIQMYKKNKSSCSNSDSICLYETQMKACLVRIWQPAASCVLLLPVVAAPSGKLMDFRCLWGVVTNGSLPLQDHPSQRGKLQSVFLLSASHSNTSTGAGKPPKDHVCKGSPAISRVTSDVAVQVILSNGRCCWVKTNSCFRLNNRGNYNSGTIPLLQTGGEEAGQ